MAELEFGIKTETPDIIVINEVLPKIYPQDTFWRI